MANRCPMNHILIIVIEKLEGTSKATSPGGISAYTDDAARAMNIAPRLSFLVSLCGVEAL